MKREEAIKIVKESMHFSYDDGNMFEALKTLVPELAESEDERIREAISYAICTAAHQDGTLINYVTKEKALAYLEKQKEPKPVEKPSKEEYIKRFKALCNAYEIKLPNREYDIYHLCDDLSKLSVDSGKQKPAEWSEEDKNIVNGAVGALEAHGHEKLAKRLKSIRPQPHWKPSEEQMKHLERCFSHGHTLQLPNQHVLESLYNDLKKL